MPASRRPTLLYLHDHPEGVSELESWLGHFMDIVPIDGSTALHGDPPGLGSIDGILADWSPDFASAIPRLRRLVAPRRVPVVVLADVTPANRVTAIMMQADYVEPFPPSPALLEAILSRWESPEGGDGSPTSALATPTAPHALSAATHDVAASPNENAGTRVAAFERVSVGDVIAEGRLLASDAESGLEFDDQRHECLVNGEAMHLPLTAFRLLRYLVEHRGLCCRREALLDEIWGAAYIPSSDVVSTTVSELRKALTPYGLRDSIRTVRGVGYLFEVEPVRGSAQERARGSGSPRDA